MFNDFFKSVEI